MDVLLILILFLAQSAGSAPPVDLSDFEGKKSAEMDSKTKIRREGVSETQMIYVDNTEGGEASPDLRHLKFAVAGRDRPGREGKILIRLQAENRVKFVRFSKDNRWSLIEIPGIKKRAWVPRAALIEEKAP
jgi:hypothetical protein